MTTNSNSTGDDQEQKSFQIELTGVPEGTITALKFIPSSNRHVIASSCDGTLRVYDFHQDSVSFIHNTESAILGCTPVKSFLAFFGGLDKSVSKIDLVAEKVTKLGTHDGVVRCVNHSDYFSPEIIISGSDDSTLKLWDPRKSGDVGRYLQSKEVFSLSALDEIVVVAMGKNTVALWDLRDMKMPLIQKSSGMPKYQTSSLCIFPDGLRFALGSTEGRVAVQYIESPSDKYVFRGHIDKSEEGRPMYHSVRAISCHHWSSYFATGGSDGLVKVWDPNTRTSKMIYSPYPTGIAALDFSENGQLLAVGCSYLHDDQIRSETPDSIPPNRIFVRCSRIAGDYDTDATIYSLLEKSDPSHQPMNDSIALFSESE